MREDAILSSSSLFFPLEITRRPSLFRDPERNTALLQSSILYFHLAASTRFLSRLISVRVQSSQWNFSLPFFYSGWKYFLEQLLSSKPTFWTEETN